MTEKLGLRHTETGLRQPHLGWVWGAYKTQQPNLLSLQKLKSDLQLLWCLINRKKACSGTRRLAWAPAKCSTRSGSAYNRPLRCHKAGLKIVSDVPKNGSENAQMLPKSGLRFSVSDLSRSVNAGPATANSYSGGFLPAGIDARSRPSRGRTTHAPSRDPPSHARGTRGFPRGTQRAALRPLQT